jgi:retron-type reverse transcriptase
MKILYRDLCDETYTISPTRRYIISDPVVREIIVLAFRDRIVQHLVHQYLYPLRDKRFIYDSYSNRVGKGTLAGIQRVDYFMRSCSHNYTRDCFVMKLDIQSCFLSVDRQILRDLIVQKMRMLDVLWDKSWILSLVKKIIFHDYCHHSSDYTTSIQRSLLPPYKSLFFVPKSQGMPLGNLTSQLFANIYLHQLDQFIKHTLKIKYYARYVDDFVLFHKNKQYLLDYHREIRFFLSQQLKMTLHPHKFYLQHYSRWVKFLGVMIYPWYRVVGKRIISNCFHMIANRDGLLPRSADGTGCTSQWQCKVYQSLMSYNGIALHHHCYRLRKQWMSCYINSLEE